MLDFKKPKLQDKSCVQKLMKESGEFGCEYCFGNLYIWSAIYGNTIAFKDNFFFARDDFDAPCYIYPCGKGDKKEAVELLLEYSKNHDNKNLVMYSLTKENCNDLEKMFPGKFKFEEQRDYFDYIYNTEDLINLSGKKYHSKKNHISYFKKTYNWEFQKIDNTNIDLCYKMNVEWENLNRSKNPEELDNENIAIERAFNKFNELGLVGGLLKADGRVVAYTMGEEINEDVFCTHIEKAFSAVRGAYPTINQEFAKMLSKYKYINREEDTGSEGLRKAKLSYKPVILLEKYTAEYIGD